MNNFYRATGTFICLPTIVYNVAHPRNSNFWLPTSIIHTFTVFFEDTTTWLSERRFNSRYSAQHETDHELLPHHFFWGIGEADSLSAGLLEGHRRTELDLFRRFSLCRGVPM